LQHLYLRFLFLCLCDFNILVQIYGCERCRWQWSTEYPQQHESAAVDAVARYCILLMAELWTKCLFYLPFSAWNPSTFLCINCWFSMIEFPCH